MTKLRNAAVLLACVICASVGGSWIARRETASPPVESPSRTAGRTMDVDSKPVDREPVVNAKEEAADPVTTYLAMRDDANSKPRLRFIEDWSRDSEPGAALDLLNQAMIDPDQSVRDRAQVLFAREEARLPTPAPRR